MNNKAINTSAAKLKSYARLIRYQLWKLNSLRYLGDKFGCPICLGSFRAMKPFSGSCYLRGIETDHYTENSICPRCHSDIRHRFIVQFMRTHTDLFNRRQAVLHFAPEINIYKMLANLDLEYIAADIDPSKFVNATYADITNIPFEDNSFDHLICIHVLEHIQDDQKAINEIYRVLKKGGKAILAVPTYGERTYEIGGLSAEQRLSEYGAKDHMRLNGLDFSEKLKKSGLSVELFSTDDVPGNYIDRSVKSPHTESDKFIFYCQKL